MDEGELVSGRRAPQERDPQVEALSGFLKQVFDHLGVSLTRYAARCHLDKGTVSRYLNGERIPPQSFVDQLLLHVAELNGHSVTAEVQQQAKRLRLEALQARNRPAYELEVLRQRLGAAEEQLHRARVRERALVDALVRREAEAAEAEQRYRQLEDAWAQAVGEGTELAVTAVDQDSHDLNDTLRSLQDELEVLRAELERAQRLKATAEEQCLRLEQQLLAAETWLGTAKPDTEGRPILWPSLESRHSAYLRTLGVRLGREDVAATAGEVATLVVPEIADIALVDLAERFLGDARGAHSQYQYQLPEQLQRAGSAHSPAAEALGWVAVTQLVGLPSDNLTIQGLLRGVPAIVNPVEASAGTDGAVLLGDVTARLSGCSLMSVPLMVNSELIGLLTLIREPGRPPFDDVDGADLAEFASRVALYLDNSRLHDREAHRARSLQRSMLPSKPPRLPGVQIAHRYLPGLGRTEVGGDWFDAVQLPGSRVALVVGDVMGHGLHSAVAMGRLRTATQALAALDLPPGQILRHLDNLSQRLGDDHLATCLYAVYDPIARTCTIASAGHVPPVLVHPDGRGELLEIPSGAPIGVGGVPFAAKEVKVTDGSMLVLCTDGLAEKPGSDVGDGLNALLVGVVDPRRSPDEVCDTVLKRLDTKSRKDDLSLLVARLDGIAPQHVIAWSLALDVRQVRRARELVREQLSRWAMPELSDEAVLLVSELVTNALRVARNTVELQMTLCDDNLLIEVSDDDHNLPSPEPMEPMGEWGRGLNVVSEVAARWGTSRKAVGKVVWFELPVPATLQS